MTKDEQILYWKNQAAGAYIWAIIASMSTIIVFWSRL